MRWAGVMLAGLGIVLGARALGQMRAGGSTPELASANIPAGLRCLQRAYPEHVCGVTSAELALCDGRRLIYDDGRSKSYAERLDDPDLEDTMAQPYDVSQPLPPPPNVEPGRVRHSALFDAMYGASAAQVQSHLTSIPWLPGVSGRKLQVSKVNGVDARLRAVSQALLQLPASLRAQVAEVAGAFNYRPIAGTERKSAHSYGIAIDVAPQLADYWRWREHGIEPPQRYRNRIPRAIVASFERQGFIWGGRWSHYDTMHFEYRPELLAADCTARAPTEVATTPPMFSWLEGRAGQPLRERIEPPAGYQRVAVAAGSFGAWLRELPLRPGRGIVHLHDGADKSSQDLHVAVIDIDTGKRDLQQCADAVMRLRAEYLFASGRADEVCFNSASGDAMPYASYRRGLRPPRGQGGPWSPQTTPDPSWSGFRGYLDRVFTIANTASLARELEVLRDPAQIAGGDVYIEPARGGRYGHAVLVLDVAQSAAGERVFLIAQSYMPAQDMHVLANLQDPSRSPWYRAPGDGSLQTPEWPFPKSSLKRFGASCHH
jgi:hypothetical protein